ncbi:tRNA uridine-5-carboxymethylaminomethyl(34) synthesis GTPase MnmE, partial [Ruminococcaceae bacterium OttesenSCG-928-A11]|nr:tRNA uridine-5-carboxymethylaminomethyl(34) synthesis GTPase MnmE [Ruminococcaceae bacterium OttesenSCG-928-A11]
MEGSTIAAIATPPGQGGIAVIRLSGPESYAVARQIFTPKNANKTLDKIPGYTAVYGIYSDGAVEIDDGIVLCFRAPHSYTGEDVLELSCHGGEAISRALLEACLKAGAQPAGPGEFTRRAVLNGRMSLTQAEAVMDLISAAGKSAAAAARTAAAGALQREISRMKEQLVTLAGHLAAWTDYPEEDVEELEMDTFSGVVSGVKNGLEGLIGGYDRGSLVRRGVRTAIVGSPNVGKSTLFNLMSGFEHAIVTPVAGTTRDVVREQISLGGVVLLLADTAGLHSTEDVVEKEGIRRTKVEMENAQLVIAVFDGSQPLRAEELAFAGDCGGRPALAVVNKSDLGLAFAPELLAPYYNEVVVVSALEPDTAQAIENAVKRVLLLKDFDPEAAMLANSRQLAAAVEARDALDGALQGLALGLDAAGVCLEDAIRALAHLTGEDATEAVINEVFSK